MFGLSPVEMMIVGVVAVLLFGSKLPNVARSLGKSMSEFKKGMHDLQGEMRASSHEAPRPVKYHPVDDREEATAPKFEPPTAEPQVESPIENQSGTTAAPMDVNDAASPGEFPTGDVPSQGTVNS